MVLIVVILLYVRIFNTHTALALVSLKYRRLIDRDLYWSKYFFYLYY